MKTEKAYFAAGCFWGVEYYLKSLKGVVKTAVGYSGGGASKPTYEQVCSGATGHAETVEVAFDPAVISYKELVRYFFSIHDFTQVNRQGPDIGEQYRSEIFFVDEDQKKVAEEVIEDLREKEYAVATKVTAFQKFWPAEDYHQEYYFKSGKEPYCHVYKKIW